MEIDVTETQKHKGIGSALAAAQSEMGKALKDTNNPHFKSKYADLSSVTDACMPALSKHGIAVIQPPYDDDTGRYVKTILIHGESGDTLECRVPLIVAKNDMQGYGSAVTYARRYGLMSMAGIAPEDDDGHAASKAPPVMEERKGPTAAETARDSLSKADTLERLQAIWTDLPANIKAVPDVLTAKDMAKARLAAVKPNEDLGGDSLPY